MTDTQTQQVSYAAIARLFLRMSLLAFGGPVAHIAMGEDEIVVRRKWLTREHYLDLIAATNLIPGPNSTEVMIHVGYVLRGIPGAILSGACFIIPAFLITLALSVAYVATGAIPAVQTLFWGIQPVIVAIILSAGWRLIPSALRDRILWALFGLSAVVIAVTDIPEVIVMLAAGLVYGVIRTGTPTSGFTAIMVLAPLMQTAVEAARASAGDLFFYFLRIGAVLFGSGYVLISYIENDLVNRFGWLTSQQLLDAVALGQFTPGPVSTTSGAVGYIVAGFPGAVLATLGVFLPSFVFVVLSAPLIPRMRRSRFLSAFLTGINAAVIAAILVTVLRLADAAIQPVTGADGFDITSGIAVLMSVAAFLAIIRFRINATWLILTGALLGFIIGQLTGV